MDLIRLSQIGDEDAFTALFHKYKNLVYKTAYLMLGNANNAEDALQEIFVKVYKSLPNFRPSAGAFSTWLHRITVNHCLNWRRKRRVREISVDGIFHSLLSVSSVSFENQLAEEERVYQALSQLSDKLRVVVILRYYWELSYAEISQILDIPLGTVKSRLNLALRTLHKKMGELAEDISIVDTFSYQEKVRK
ncbi:MAG: RNA polymerase sigma factor [Anaerolineaceae bacterium]|nr:RNA polymerase sigma factor [Anaerolineaceae bacterium]